MIERSDSNSDFVVDTALDTNSLPIAEILVAQADTGATNATDATPPDAAPAQNQASLVVEVGEGSVLTLPEGTSIDAPRMNGANLEFVQPDGSVVVVPNGAIEGLTIVLGSVEIPPLTVAALFAASDIQTAAGPAGNGPPSSGGNFEVQPAGDIGSAFTYGGLLDGTDLPTTETTDQEAYDNNLAPRFAFSITEARLSEEGLAGGNADSDGNADTTNNFVYSGNLNASDPNGDPLTFRFGQPTSPVTSQGVTLTWTGVGTATLSGWAGDTLVIQAVVTNGSGAFTLTLSGPVDHPAGAGENELRFDLPITASDGRGGSASTAISIIVEDDSPTVGVSANTGEGAPALVISLDETVGNDVRDGTGESGNTGNGNTDDVEGAFGQVRTLFEGGLAALFNVSGGYGADGAGSSTAVFSFTGIPAGGLATTLSATHGGLITLFLEDGMIVGRDAANDAVFKIEIVGAPGAEQLQTTLFEAISHNGEGNLFDEKALLQLLGDGAAQLKFDVTRTDFDGDTTTNSATIDLVTQDSTVISFEDDGPRLGAVATQTVAEQTANGASNAFTSTTLSNVSLNVTWGSDGPNAQNLAFTTAAGDSGLTSNGQAVNYSITGTLLTAATAGGREIFTVKLNSDGSYTFTLKDNIDHTLGSDTKELTFGFKATDGDGDSVNGSFQVNVTDSVPTIGTTETETVSEQNLPFFLDDFFPDGSNSLVQPGKLNIDWNADDNNSGTANRSVGFANLVAPTDLTSDGKAVVYSYNSDHSVLTATAGGQTVFTVSLSDTGTGTYTFSLYGNIDHAVGTDTKALDFGFVATDADGDTATSSFTVNVLDDHLSLGSVGVRYVEEEALPHGNNDASPLGVEVDGVLANLASGVIGISSQIGASLNIAWGNDNGNSAVNGGYNGTQVMGDRSVVFGSGSGAARVLTAPEVAGLVSATGGNGSATLTSHGQPLVYTLSANGAVITASAGGHDVFSVTLSDQSNGSYTFKLLGTLDHPVAASGANNEDVLSLKFNFTARDGDGDQGVGNFVVRVIDDSPVVGPVAQLDVNELTSDSVQNAFLTQMPPNVSLNIQWGADGAKTDGLVFTTGSGAVSGLTSNGTQIAYTVAGNVLTASAGARQIFTVTLNSDGTYSFVLKDNIDHASGSDTKELSFGFKATDGDGDFATGTFKVNIVDSVPTIGTTEIETVSEQNLPFFLDGLNPDGSDSLVQPGKLNIDWNADDNNSGTANRSVAFADLVAPADLTSDGKTIVYTYNAAHTLLTATAGGETVFTVSLSDTGTGTYTFSLYGNIDHAVGTDIKALDFGFVAKDADGDTASSSFTVNVLDDHLSLGSVGVRYVEEEALPHGNNDASPLDVEVDGVIANLGPIGSEIGASLNISWGNDNGNSAVNGGYNGTQVMGDRSVVFASGNGVARVLTAPEVAGLVSASNTNGAIMLTSHGQPLVYTLSANGTVITASAGGQPVFSVTLSDQSSLFSSGSYTFKLLGTLDHPIAASGANNEDVLSLKFNFTARDGDGDQGAGNFTVRVIDDSPVIGSVAQLNVSEVTSEAFANTFITQTPANASLNIHWGADGAKTDGLVFTTQSGAVNGLTSNGTQIAYTVAGNVLTASAGAREVFSVTLNSDGTYSFVLKDNIDHASGSNDKLLSFGFQATDADNDTATGTFSVNIKDSVPLLLAGAADSRTITESVLPQVSYTSGSLNVDINADDKNTHVEIAKDAQGHYILPQGLTSDGVALDYIVRTANGVDQEIVAFKQGEGVDRPVFIVAVVHPGNLAATLFQNLDHAPGSNTLAINLTARVYDGDGDYVDRAFTVNVTDTVPELVGQSDTGTLAEGGLPYVSSTFGNLHVNLNADDKNTHVEIAKDSNGHYILPQGLTSDGVALDYIVRTTNGVDQEIVAFKQGEGVDRPVFIVAVLHPGSFAATLFQNLDHAQGSDTLAINLTARVYDGDGDYVDRAFTVNVADDAPTLTDPKVHVNLLTNGDFAHGTWTDGNWGGGFATEAVGWKITGTEPAQGNVQLEFVQNGYLGMHAPAGGRMVDLGSSPGNTAISQALSGLTVGQPYTLTFAMGSPDPASSKLEVYWNGQLVQNSSVLVTGTMSAVTIGGLLPDAHGNGVLTFKEVGTADATGTYLADIGLAPTGAVNLPFIGGSIDENGTATINLGAHFSFGADGPGSVSVNPATVVITTPTGTVLGQPSITVDPVTGQLHVNPGWGFDGLSQGEIATITIPYTVTDHDGDSKTGLYQLTINGQNDQVRTSIGFPDSGTITEYAEDLPNAGSAAIRTEFDAPAGHAGHNGGGFHIYDDQGDTHSVTVTPGANAGYLGSLVANVSEETAGDGNGFVTWLYSVSDAALNPLQAGETKIETFTVRVSDGHGTFADRVITVTLVGTNDTPVVSVDAGDVDHVVLNETNAGLQADGTLSVIDVDVKDVVSATVTGATATGLGANFTDAQLKAFFSIGAGPVIDGTHTSGDIAWNFNSGSEAFNFLSAGAEAVIKYTIQVSDGHGGNVSHDVEIKLIGTNDLPVVDLNGVDAGSNASATAVEQSAQYILTAATLSDVDSSQMASMTVRFVGRPDGTLESLSLNPAAQAAAAGLTVTYNSTLGSLTITGSASVSAYQTILRGVSYFNNSDNPAGTGHSVEVIVNDGLDNSVAHTVDIKVIPINDAPVLGGTLHSTVLEGGMVTLTATELGYTDPDNSASGVVFRVTALNGGEVRNNGAPATSFTAAELASGIITFVHNGSEASLAGFTVAVEDGNQDGSTPVPKPFIIDVTPVNDAPVVVVDANATAVEQFQQYILSTASLTDVDSSTMNSMTVKFVGRPDGTLETLSLNPAAQAAATGLSVVYNATSGVLTITGTASVAAYQTILRGVTYFNNSDTPTPTGHSVEVVVNDGFDSSTAQTVAIKVIPLNDAPVLGGTLHSTVADGGTVILTAAELGYTDPDNTASEVVFRVSSVHGGEVRNHGAPANSFTAAELASGIITFAHSGSGSGTAGFIVAVEDGNQDGSTPIPQPFIVNVIPDVVVDPNATALEQIQQYILSTATLSDVDSSTLNSMTIKFVGRPDGAFETLSLNPAAQAAAAGLSVVFDTASGVLTITGTASAAAYQTVLRGVTYFNNSDTPTPTGHSVQVVVNDGYDNSTVEAVAIKVIPLNDAPVLGGTLHSTVVEGGIVTLTAAQLGYTDPDNSASEVVFRITSLNGGEVRNNGAPAISFTAAELASGIITFVHNGSEASQAGFSVAVEDGNQDGSTPVSQPFVINVTPVNDAPIAFSDSYTVNEDQVLTVGAGGVLANDIDVDSTLSAILVSGPAHGSLVLNPNGTFTYTPSANYNGPDSFVYKATDGALSTAPTTVNLTVTPVNDLPTAPADTNNAANAVAENAAAGTIVGLTAQSTDADGDAVTYSLTNDANGRFTIDQNTGVVTVKAGAVLNYETATQHTITVQASDGHGGLNASNFTIAVKDIQEGPVGVANSSAFYAFSNNATAPAGKPTSITLDMTSLFVGTAAGTTYSFETVRAGDGNSEDSTISNNLNASKWSWLTRTGDVLQGVNPEPVNAGVYILKIIATAPNGGGSAFTYVALTVLDGSATSESANNVVTHWVGNEIILPAGQADGNDVHGKTGTDILIGNGGNNSLFGDDMSDALYGGVGVDYLDGGSQSDFIAGGAGNDVIYGRDGADTILGEDGDDAIDSGAGNDIVVGGAGNDIIFGSDGNDILYGNDGDDRLYANSGDDKMYGGAGDDLLTDDSGNDTYYFGLKDGQDVIDEGSGDSDRIVITAAGAKLDALNAYDTVEGKNLGNLVIEFNGQSIRVENHFVGVNDRVELINFDGATYKGYHLGSGDYAVGRDSDSSNIRLPLSTNGNDFLVGEAGATNAFSGDGGNDLMFGGNLADNLSGGQGNDLLIGGGGNDILTGNEGDDILWGGLGHDTLTGGTGNDTFVFSEAGVDNSDTISDYVVGDVVDLSDLLSGIANDQKASHVQVDAAANTISVAKGNGWELVATIQPSYVGSVDIKIADDLAHIQPII